MPRGPFNALHAAASNGFADRTVALLSSGFDINLVDDQRGLTPLMLGARGGYTAVVRTLLAHGARVSMVDDLGFNALHCSARGGYLACSKILLDAGADLEGTADGGSPLYLASEQGHAEMARALIEAGADTNARALGGATPLFGAACKGHVDVVGVLLGSQADPLLIDVSVTGGRRYTFVPLDGAAQGGHSRVVRELLQHFGLAGCGGPSGGLSALRLVSDNQHVDIISMLASAGAVDTGIALGGAACLGRAASVKTLLQHFAGEKTRGDRAYVDSRDDFGATPLLGSIRDSCSSRVLRLLVDAGANTKSAIRIKGKITGAVKFDDTPLALTTRCIADKTIFERINATSEWQPPKLEAIRRVLVTVEAARAVSWLWVAGRVAEISTAEAAVKASTTGTTPLDAMFPLLGRRSRRRGALLAALFRWGVARGERVLALRMGVS